MKIPDRLIGNPRYLENKAGLGAGTSEAVLVVTPMEVVKIRLQAQSHSLADPLEVPQYRNAAHAVYRIVTEEGISALYRGVTLTAVRQATNQGETRCPLSVIGLSFVSGLTKRFIFRTLLEFVRTGANFTAYQELKKFMHKMQPDLKELPSYQHMAVGLISGACGPLTNAPIDTIKTRKSNSLIGYSYNDVLSQPSFRSSKEQS